MRDCDAGGGNCRAGDREFYPRDGVFGQESEFAPNELKIHGAADCGRCEHDPSDVLGQCGGGKHAEKQADSGAHDDHADDRRSEPAAFAADGDENAFERAEGKKGNAKTEVSGDFDGILPCRAVDDGNEPHCRICCSDCCNRNKKQYARYFCE